MKVIKNGKRNYGEFKFKCNKCGCKFEADVSDYIFVERDKVDWNVYHPTENNTPSDTIRCKCPNCDEELDKNIYEKRIGFKIRHCTIQSVMAVINIVLLILTLIAILDEPRKEMTDFQIFVNVSSIMILMVDAAVHMCAYVDLKDD